MSKIATTDIEYKKHPAFKSLHPETRFFIELIMELLRSSHAFEASSKITGRDLLAIYSPDNLLLKSSDNITWGLAAHSLLSEVLTGECLKLNFKIGRLH
tara:strand:- start:232 stop:528 length:297 start_codon:yes stop_codon:yes gene_type:complete